MYGVLDALFYEKLTQFLKLYLWPNRSVLLMDYKFLVKSDSDQLRSCRKTENTRSAYPRASGRPIGAP